MSQDMAVADLAMLPIPPALSAVDTDEYQVVPIDQKAPEYAEPLVKLKGHHVASRAFYGRRDLLNAPLYQHFESGLPDVHVRESVANRLVEVNKILAPYRVEVLVMDGFRPIAVQRELWSWNLRQASDILPDPTEQECARFALRYCSNPEHFDEHNPATYPTHSTGAAVDLTLIDIQSQAELFMGGIYLDPSDVTATRYFEVNQRIGSLSDREARRNRRLLFWSMTRAGFVNYPYEWWHFDYLTQASIMNQGFPEGRAAHYGLANRGEAPL